MLREGQKWQFEGDLATEKSYLIIRKIEIGEKCSETVHISIRDISIQGELWDIAHLPVALDVVKKSLKSEIPWKSDEDDPREYDEAYQIWKKENGGVWNIDLKEIINLTLRNATL